MIEISCQLTNDRVLYPATPEDMEKLKAYLPNQIVRAKISGYKRQRSVQLNKWIHNIFRLVADNSGDPGWSTVEQVKRKVKLMMQFFSDRFVVDGKVYFQLRSFAFDQMEQPEADRVYNEAKEICAQKLGVDPGILEAQAKDLPF